MRTSTGAFKRQTIGAFCFGAVVALSAHAVLSVEQAPAPGRLDDLLQKRLTLLEQYERAMKERIQIDPQMNPLLVHPATVAVMNARLELAKSPEDRLRVLEDMVKSAEDWDRFVDGLINSGRMGKWEGLKSKAEVLEAQIALERFKESVKQSTSRP
jgi:hypothetical protein